MTMPAKEAAKLLREHLAIRRKAGTGNPCLNQAIDAASHSGDGKGGE